MSLQTAPVRNAFVNTCADLWRTWNSGPVLLREHARKQKVRQALTAITGFMPAPTLVFLPIKGWGGFMWGPWRLELNLKYVTKHDIKYGKFVEFCTTIYHETRHAEQFYRIAQGLAQGRLTYPD